MKHLIMILISLFTFSTLSFSQSLQSIKLEIDPWYPWVIGENGDTPTKGVGVQLIKALYKEINITAKIKIVPFKRVLLNLRRGDTEGSWLLSKTPAREKYLEYSIPLLSDCYYVYYRSWDVFRWSNWVDLKPFKIGLTAGFNYGDNFKNAAKKYKFKTYEVRTDNQLIRMLLKGRLDIILLNETVASALVQDNVTFKGQIKQAPKIVKETLFYVVLSRKAGVSYLLPRINKAIKSLKASDTIAKILNH